MTFTDRDDAKDSGKMSLGLLDTTSRDVHVFSLKRGGDLTIREFISTVEEELSQLTQDGATCVRVLCAAVGASCINICDKMRTVRYYLLDGEPWFIKTGVFPSSLVDVHIKEINMEHGNEAAIKIDLDKSLVKDLKQKFAKMTCTFLPNLHLVFGRKELENDQRLSDYNLTSGCVVPCMSGGERRRMFPAPHIHIPSHLQLPENAHLGNGHDAGVIGHSGHSPVWRRATPGLWLEGVCCNEICVAYSKYVVMNQGFADLDFMSDKHKYQCPMCYEQVSPVAYGLNRCEWGAVGLQRTSLDSAIPRPRVTTQGWQKLAEGYSCFVPDRGTWLMLKITARELNRCYKYCVLCMSSVASGIARVPCGHVYHASCLKTDTDCLQCIGRQSMTVYQRHFLSTEHA